MELTVDLQAKRRTSPDTGETVIDYMATLGPDDSQSTVCFDAESTLIFTLTDSSRCAFRDIAFDNPFGFEPAGSPFKLWAVHPQSIVVHVAPTSESTALTFKYTLKVQNLKTGSMISTDPPIINR
jgi:hypothetical protein